MDKHQEIIELYANADICKIMRNYLEVNKKSGLCNIFEADEPNIIIRSQNKEKTYNTPVRLGEILDRLVYYKNNPSNGNALIDLDGATLDINQGAFINKVNEQIYLTEKEVAILSYLHSNKGKVVSREELLKSVWNYATDIETHTLETHIYRLRQKIEVNPANPIILVTKEDGYSV